VAPALPVAFWRLRHSLDHARLRRAATRRNERHALGLVLELASWLGGDRRLMRFTGGLHDGRRTARRDFFAVGAAPVPRTAAEGRLVAIGRRWGFEMNAELGGFIECWRSSAQLAERPPATRRTASGRPG